MKKFLLAMCMSMAMVVLVTPVFATELWDPHLRGVDGGLAAGALPPAGFYLVDNNWFAPDTRFFGPDGKVAGLNELSAYVNVPVLLWSTGLKFLCADYGVAIAQPFDWVNLKLADAKGVYGGDSQMGTFNTIFVPYILSWKLPYDFRVKTSFSVGFDDAMTSPGWVPPGAQIAPAGNGTWMFTPTVGVSWLHEGWNLSAEFFYTFNTKNGITHYWSNDQFAADYTITYTYKKWTFGMVAAEENEVGDDQLHGVSVPGTKAELYTIGPTLGYNFGPCSLSFTWNTPLYTQSDVGANWFNVRLVIPLGNPFASK